MSSVQTGQLISLLINNVLMVIIVAAVTLFAWLRWRWLRVDRQSRRSVRRSCRWAYVSFVLAAMTLLGMLVSLGMLSLRAMVAVNALVVGAMGMFLLSVMALLLALGLWLFDLCCDLPVTQRVRQPSSLRVPSVAFFPVSVNARSTSPRRLSRRAQRRQVLVRSKSL
ncbi:MAG: hypothetical protein F6K11_08215 [Leptolyngbya sp. SIO3F4]|nr:hypothetical protein [Leptolyngbya sp. SIO3F4]